MLKGPNNHHSSEVFNPSVKGCCVIEDVVGSVVCKSSSEISGVLCCHEAHDGIAGHASCHLVIASTVVSKWHFPWHVRGSVPAWLS